MMRWKLIASLLILAALTPSTSRAKPRSDRLNPPPVIFSSTEIEEYELQKNLTYSSVLVGVTTGAVVALVGAGVSLLALGLEWGRGSAKMTTSSMVCLGSATFIGFVGIQVIQW